MHSKVQQVLTCIQTRPGVREATLQTETGLSLLMLRRVLYGVLAYKGLIFWIGSGASRRFFQGTTSSPPA